KLKLLGESSVSFAASASALARIRPMISPVQQRALGLWMERSSGRLSRRKDFELDRAEVIGLLRALVACSKLQSRMLSCCLKVLQKDSESLAPSQMLVVLLALRTIRPRRLNDQQLWFLRRVQSRFEEFRLPQLALALWRLHGIQEELADGAEMRQMIESGTARFRSARLRWPQAPWRRHAEAGETPSANQAEEVDLSMEEWRWLANSALPCPLLHDQGEGPMPWTAELLRPFASWVVAVADEIKTEADLLVSITSSFTSAEDEDAVTPESFAHRCLVEETVDLVPPPHTLTHRGNKVSALAFDRSLSLTPSTASLSQFLVFIHSMAFRFDSATVQSSRGMDLRGQAGKLQTRDVLRADCEQN
ncbi:ANKRD50, partial [Symbiodinium sp. CCMP2456]